MSLMFKSLTFRLLAYLVSLITIVWLAIALSSFVFMQRGAGQILDMQLKQMAKALAEIPTFSYTDLKDGEEQIAEAEFYQVSPVYFQIWRNGKLYLSNSNIIVPDIKGIPEGFSTLQIKQEMWRFYYHQSKSASERKIYTFVKENGKYSFIDPLIEIVGFHLIAEIITIIFIILFAVYQSLRPLRTIVNDIAFKNYNNLDSIPLVDIPQETIPLVTSINSLLARLHKSISLEKEFTAHAAHELKTPLAALKMQAQVALNEKSKNIQKQQIEKIVSGVNRANHVVSQMLMLAQYEGEVCIKRQELNLSEVINIVAEDLSPFIIKKQIRIEKEYENNLLVIANKDSIYVLIKNILDNAIRYSPDRSRILLQTTFDKGKFILLVEDEGIGIPVDIRDKIFERFYRGENIDGSEGSGLGLSIVQRICEINDITIQAKPRDNGQGSIFQITF